MREDVLQYLKDNLYLVSLAGKQIITNKFLRECGISPVSTKPVTNKSIKKFDMKETYKLFISEAKVPSQIPNGKGGFFWGNRYSIDGEKAFTKIFNDPAIDKAVLLRATKWYYEKTNTSRKMIGNYFSEGIWESCYDDFVKALAENKITPKDDDKERNTLRL